MFASYFEGGEIRTVDIFSDREYSNRTGAYVTGLKLLIGRSIYIQPQIKGISYNIPFQM